MHIQRNTKSSLAYQVVTFIILASVVVFALMLIMHNFLIRQIMITNATAVARSLTYENISHIEYILSKVETQNEFIAYNLRQNPLPNAHIRKYIKTQMIDNSEFNSVCITYNPEYLAEHPELLNGIFYIDGDSLVVKPIDPEFEKYIYEDWFAIPTTLNMGYWTEPWYSHTGTGKLVSSYTLPMHSSDGKTIIGVLRLDVSLQVLQQIVASVRMLGTGYAFLASHNGTIVTHPADSLIMNYSVFSYARQIGSEEVYTYGLSMVKGQEDLVRLRTPYRSDKRWMYFAPIRKNGWTIGVIFSEGELFSDLNRITLIFSLILVGGFLMIISMVYFRIVLRLKPLGLLALATEKIGKGDFEAELPVVGQNNEISTLAEGLGAMQTALKSYMENLLTTKLAKDKIETEIRFASEIQKNLIPSNTSVGNMLSEVSIFGLFEPAGEVGGDLYDVFLVNDNKLCFGIADVFGKGIVASMIMTMVQTLLRSNARHVDTVKDLVKQINSFLCENNKHSNFVTILVGFLDLKTGMVEYCNAGHTPLYMRKANKQCIRFGETHSTALGIFPNLNVTSSVLQLDTNDELIIYTDGITEAMSKDEVFFGYQKFENTLCNLRNPTPESTVKSILNSVREFTGLEQQSDDISILVLKFNHPRLKVELGG